MDFDKLDVKEKRVLVRVDFNVPLDKDYRITDDTRMQRALPTINSLRKRGAKIILMSHLGRPQKKKKEDGSIDIERFTLRHLVEHLENLTKTKVYFSPSTVGGEAEVMSERLLPGEILLLENTRFFPGETKGDENLALRMSRLGDIYINDAFGTAHRAHASTAIVARYFDRKDKALGLLMQEEIYNADKLLKSPSRPFVAIIGGAKVSDKIKLLDRLIEVVNMVCIGGGMAYTFIKAGGGDIGDSLCEDDYLDLAMEIVEKANDLGTELFFPLDSMIADRFGKDAEKKVSPSDQIPSGWMGLDIGPEAIEAFTATIKKAKTILWNGPMGVFEFPDFAQGTLKIAKAVAEATNNGAFSLIGGGDSVAAINQSGLADQVSFISTGGGAMLEYLEGKTLPGIKAIFEKGVNEE